MSHELTPFGEVTPPPEVRFPVNGEPRSADRASLGRLAGAAAWISARIPSGAEPTRPRWVLIAGDHDGPDHGSGVDWTVAAAVAESLGVDGRRIDVATARDDRPGGDRWTEFERELHICAGHASPTTADVLSRAHAVAAVDAGRRLADQEIDGGADLLIPGLVGSGHAVPLGALTAVFTGLEPVAALPMPDTDFAVWGEGVTALRDSLFRIRDQDKDAVSLIAAVGGADLGALAGFIAQAAVRRTPVLLDGLPATSAAVLAHRLAPGTEAWCLAAGESTDRGGRRLQDMLGLNTVVTLETDSPAAVGALLVLPLIIAAIRASAVPGPAVPTAAVGSG